MSVTPSIGTAPAPTAPSKWEGYRDKATYQEQTNTMRLFWFDTAQSTGEWKELRLGKAEAPSLSKLQFVTWLVGPAGPKAGQIMSYGEAVKSAKEEVGSTFGALTCGKLRAWCYDFPQDGVGRDLRIMADRCGTQWPGESHSKKFPKSAWDKAKADAWVFESVGGKNVTQFVDSGYEKHVKTHLDEGTPVATQLQGGRDTGHGIPEPKALSHYVEQLGAEAVRLTSARTSSRTFDPRQGYGALPSTSAAGQVESENGEEAVQEEAEAAPVADPRLIEQRDALSRRINAQLDLTELHLDLPELRKAIDELNQLHSDNEDALPPLDDDLIDRAEARYAKVKDEQSPAAERKLEGLFGPSVLEHAKKIFEGAPSDFDATIADARRLGLDAERIDAAKDLDEKAEASASALRDATRLDSRVSAFLAKACEALLDFGIDSLEKLGSLGLNIGEFQDVQSLCDDLTAVLLDKELLRGEGLKKRDVQIRLRGLLSLCWLPVGVHADAAIALLRGCDRNYENEEDGLKLSAMESLEHGFFEVAKAAHVTDKSSLLPPILLQAPVAAANDPGYLFIKACFEQLQPPREPDVTIAEHQVTIAKHHNMLRLVGPSKSGKSELAKLLARLYVASVDKPEDRLEGRWLEMDQILPDTSERSVWVAEVLGQPIKIWGPLKYLWHLAKKKPEARFALIMPEANRGDLFNILNRHWFEPRNRLGVSSSELPGAAPPVNLCIIFTENPVTANGAYQVMGGDEALGTRLTRDQTAAVEHGRVIDGVLVGKVEEGLCNPELRFDMRNFAQFFVRNHDVDDPDPADLASLARSRDWKATLGSVAALTTMGDFFSLTSSLHVGDQHRIADQLCRGLKRKREAPAEEAPAEQRPRVGAAAPATAATPS